MKVFDRLSSTIKQLIFFISIVLLHTNSFGQEAAVRYKYGIEMYYSPSFNFVEQRNGNMLDQSVFDTIVSEEYGRVVHPIGLNFTFDATARLRLKLGVGYQSFGYHSPRYVSQIANNAFTEVTFREAFNYVQTPISIQFFALKNVYVEGSYIPLFFLQSRSTHYLQGDDFTAKTVTVSKIGYHSFNQMLALSIGYQARLGESSVSFSLAPKISYVLGELEESTSQIQRSHFQVGLNFSIHTFL